MLTIVTRACQEVEGFDHVCQRLEKKMIINGKGLSTFQNYLRCIAHLVIHYQALPMQITESQVEDYLFMLKKRNAAESFFKHTIYGLRFLYRAKGMPAWIYQHRCAKVFDRGRARQRYCVPSQLAFHIGSQTVCSQYPR